MSIESLFVNVADIFITANDHVLNFYHNSGIMNVDVQGRMKLYRSVVVADVNTRVVGISVLPKESSDSETSNNKSAEFYNVHAVTSKGGYIVIDLSSSEVISSGSVPEGDGSDISSALWRYEYPARTQHRMGVGVQCVVWLSAIGVSTSSVDSIVDRTVTAATPIFTLKAPMPNLVMTVGLQNGVCCIGQLGQKWLWVSFSGVYNSNRQHMHLTLPLRLRCVKVSPANSLSSVNAIACGGTLGELVYYTLDEIKPDTDEAQNSRQCRNQLYQDHWHHTPLSALGFSVDGRQLLTAGAEATLLSWNIKANFSHKKILSPRKLSNASGNWRKDKDSFAVATGGVITAPVLAIVPSNTNHNNFILVCANSQILSVHLGEQRIVGSIECGSWSVTPNSIGAIAIRSILQDGPITNGEVNNILHSKDAQLVTWKGRCAIMLLCNTEETGAASDSIRICDITSLEAMHTLQVSYNEEATAGSLIRSYSEDVRTGLTLACMADNGALLITYEHLASLGLNSVLRFWRLYPEGSGHYVEVQQIYTPHAEEVVAMCLEEQSGVCSSGAPRPRRLFTLSRSQIKSWQAVTVDAHEVSAGGNNRLDTFAVGTNAIMFNSFDATELNKPKTHDVDRSTLWRAISSHSVSSGRGSSLCVASDGSVVGVADDNVTLLDVTDVTYAAKGPVCDWGVVLTLTQSHTKAVLHELNIDTGAKIIVARTALCDGGKLFVWSLTEGTDWHLAVRDGCVACNLQGSTIAVAEVDASAALVVTETHFSSSSHELQTISDTASAVVTTLSSYQRSRCTTKSNVTEAVDIKKMQRVAAATVRCLLNCGVAKYIMLDNSGLRRVNAVRASLTSTTTGDMIQYYSKGPLTGETADRNAMSTYFQQPQGIAVMSVSNNDTITDNNKSGNNSNDDYTNDAALVSKLLQREAFATPSMASLLSSYLRNI